MGEPLVSSSKSRKGDSEMDILQLRQKARRHGLMLRSDRHNGYMLVDPYTNGLAAPGPMSLEQVVLWLDNEEDQALVDDQEKGVCCLCGKRYEHCGNNPYPLCDEDDYTSRCCDTCNWTKVIPARLQKREGTA